MPVQALVYEKKMFDAQAVPVIISTIQGEGENPVLKTCPTSYNRALYSNGACSYSNRNDLTKI